MTTGTSLTVGWKHRLAQEGARKSRVGEEGTGKVGRSQAAEPVMGPLATDSWWLTAGGPRAQIDFPPAHKG